MHFDPASQGNFQKNICAHCSAVEKAKSCVAQRTTHVWWSVSVLGGQSIIYRDHKIKNWSKRANRYSHRHTDGFVQDCSISGALAMEILQSCAKPCMDRISMHLRSCWSTFLRNIFLQNTKNSLVAKWTIHGSPVGFMGRIWRLCFSSTATAVQV